MIGQEFGSWLVIGEAPPDYARQARWRCVCRCGQAAIVYQNALRRGTSTTCGSCTRRKSPLLLTPAPEPMTIGAALAVYAVGRRPTHAELSAAMRHSNKRRKGLGAAAS